MLRQCVAVPRCVSCGTIIVPHHAGLRSAGVMGSSNGRINGTYAFIRIYQSRVQILPLGCIHKVIGRKFCTVVPGAERSFTTISSRKGIRFSDQTAA
jgi:hypothetical protein